MTNNSNITGTVNGVSYSVSQEVVDTLKNVYNLDAVKEIESAIKKEANESQSTKE